MAVAVAGRLSPRLEELARLTATAVRLDDLYRWGKGDLSVRLQMARFLHKEVAIRNAQLCKELRWLPFGLADTVGVSEVLRTFSGYVDRLAESPSPQEQEDDERFTELMRGILEDQLQVVSTLGRGVQEVRCGMGEERYESVRNEVDHILDRFFMKRIGLRFLIQHYIESAHKMHGVSGIIHSNVAVGQILRQEAQEAVRLCRDNYGVAPEVIVIGDGKTADAGDGAPGFGSSLHATTDLLFDRVFTYVPTHLSFSCSVLLQNACFASAERYTRLRRQRPAASLAAAPPMTQDGQAPSMGSRSNAHLGAHGGDEHDGDADGMPPVQAIFSHGEDEVMIKISDEGGGIPRSKQHLLWSYFGDPSCDGLAHSRPLGAGNPTGAGLPLARLHARYYGGDLLSKTIEGFGTDVHMFLNRLGQNCEHLPHGVRISPAMRDSSLGEDMSLAELGTLTPREAVFLKERLADFRRQRAQSVQPPPF